MRIDEVRASAFGPFRSSTLRLGPGMNVIHGMNEAGKSSWFAATYAGLAGRRKARGRGTSEQADFRNRHKPWTGSQWSAGVTVTLDDGSVLAFEQDLSKGEFRIVDGETRRTISVAELEHRSGVELTSESTLDATRLLGLNRDSARATIFTGQADVLRVLEDAGELQEFLERAATTEVADATAEGALAWLGDFRSEHVGSEYLGRKPLRARQEELAQARAVSGQRRDQLIRLLGVMSERRRIGDELARAKQQVDRVTRFDQWSDIQSRRHRITQAQELAAQVASTLSLGVPAQGVDEDRVHAATMILGAYDAGSDAQPLPEGATSAELEAEIAALPARPEGDLEPRSEILEARDALTRAQAALQTHADGASESGAAVPPGVEAEELRALAGALESHPTATEPGLAEELERLQRDTEAATEEHRLAQAAYDATVQRNDERRRAYADEIEEHARLTSEFEKARAEYLADMAADKQAAESLADTARQRRTVMTLAGGAILVVGVVLALVGQPLLGILVALAGAAVLVAGVISRPPRPSAHRASSGDVEPTRKPPPGPPDLPDLPHIEEATAPVPPPVNPRIMDLQVALAAQERSRNEHGQRLALTRARLHDLGLPADPLALRQLARSIDDAVAARDRQRRHEELGTALRRQRDDAANALARALEMPQEHEVSDAHVARLIQAVADYIAGCRDRAITAKLADRRTDLAAALDQRRQLESERASAAAYRDRQVSAVVEFVRDLGDIGDHADIPASEAAERMRAWLAEQQRARIDQAARSELTARIDQLLEGRPLEEWQRELADLVATAGPEPDDIPDDIEAFRDQVTSRYQLVLRRAGELAGQQEQLSSTLGDVARAVEEEASAERALERTVALRDCIDAATDQLKLARDRAHANIAPELQAKMRPLLPRITDGRYLDVSVDPSDLTVKVTEASGALREARLLSQGTMEQIFILLRIALAQVLSGSHEGPPLVFDDVTVQSDPVRTSAILTMLHELSRDHQVIVFTQEQEVVDWATGALDPDRDLLIPL
jgi:hypothetical protein